MKTMILAMAFMIFTAVAPAMTHCNAPGSMSSEVQKPKPPPKPNPPKKAPKPKAPSKPRAPKPAKTPKAPPKPPWVK